MPETKGKVWGKTTTVYENSIFSVHYLNINKGGYCSEHKHSYKVNVFYIIRGALEITIYENDFEDKTILKSGQLLSVEPNKFHKFNAIEDTECLEVYKPRDLNLGPDIYRKTVGGIK